MTLRSVVLAQKQSGYALTVKLTKTNSAIRLCSNNLANGKLIQRPTGFCEHLAFSANKTLKNTSDHQDAVLAQQCQVDVQKFQISVTAAIVQVASASKFDTLIHVKGRTQK